MQGWMSRHSSAISSALREVCMASVVVGGHCDGVQVRFRGTKWVVFEPNDEPLWAQIRLNVGSFMHGLFRQGAFQGKTPREAYLVKCDAETTTQADRDRGIVNIYVGFAPLKPAEFVVIRLQQLAGQIET